MAYALSRRGHSPCSLSSCNPPLEASSSRLEPSEAPPATPSPVAAIANSSRSSCTTLRVPDVSGGACDVSDGTAAAAALLLLLELLAVLLELDPLPPPVAEEDDADADREPAPAPVPRLAPLPLRDDGAAAAAEAAPALALELARLLLLAVLDWERAWVRGWTSASEKHETNILHQWR